MNDLRRCRMLVRQACYGHGYLQHFVEWGLDTHTCMTDDCEAVASMVVEALPHVVRTVIESRMMEIMRLLDKHSSAMELRKDVVPAGLLPPFIGGPAGLPEPPVSSAGSGGNTSSLAKAPKPRHPRKVKRGG